MTAQRRTWGWIGVVAGLVGLSVLETHAQSALTLHLTTNQAVFGPGTTLRANVGVTYAGPPVTVDLLFGVILPDGVTVVGFGPGMQAAAGRTSRLSSIPTFFPRITLVPGTDVIVPGLLQHTWSGGEGDGIYRLFLAAVTPGAFRDDRIDPGDVLAVQFADVMLQPPAAITLDSSKAGAATIGPAGGRVTATAADGTVFALDVPVRALSQPTLITLTPVSSLTGAPGGLQQVMAVQASPEGLRFAVPARLTVTPPGPVPSRGWFGIGMTSAGAGLDLSPAGAAGGSVLALVVEHFSVLGVAIPTVGTLPAAGAPRVLAYSSRLLAATTPAEFAAIYDEWFAAFVEPPLRTGQSDPQALFLGMREYLDWDLSRLVYTGTDATAHAASTRGKTLVANGLRVALAHVQGACLAAPSLATAEEVLQLQNFAWAYFDLLQFIAGVGIFIPAPVPSFTDVQGLDLASVLSLLCVKAEIVSITFPGTFQPGTPSPMTVVAGLRFTNGQGTATPPLQIAIDATGATPTQRTGVTNGAGSFTTTFTPNAGNLRFDVTAALVDGTYPFLSLAPLVATSRLTRAAGGVVVTPSQTTIAPGSNQQFTANQSVTWTVTGGGSISTSGMFTSNGTLGTFFVTATSVVDPTEVGIAQVTVAVPTTGSYEITVRNSGVQGVARVGATSRSFSRPLAQAQLLADEMKQFIAPASVLTSALVVFASDVQTDVTLDIDLSGYPVTGVAAVAAGPNSGSVCTIPSRPNVRLKVGNVDGGASVQACAGTFELVTGAVSRGVSVLYVGAGSRAVLRAASVGEYISVTECRGGQVTVETPTALGLQLALSDHCTFSFPTTTFSRHVQVTNVQASTLGRIVGGALGAVSMRFNPGTTYALQATSVGGSTGVVFELEGTQTRLSDVSVGSITGIVRLVTNSGFSNADAHAFLDALGHTGTRTITGNVP